MNLYELQLYKHLPKFLKYFGIHFQEKKREGDWKGKKKETDWRVDLLIRPAISKIVEQTYMYVSSPKKYILYNTYI